MTPDEQKQLEELQQTVSDYNVRIGRVTRAKASLKRLTSEYDIARENKKTAENELDLAISDLDNHRQVGLPLGEPVGAKIVANGIDVKAPAGAETLEVSHSPKGKTRTVKTKASDTPVTTDGYAIGQRVAHAKREGEFEVTEVIDARHLRVKPLSGKSQTPVKVNVANLHPVVDATAAAATA